MSSRAIEVRIHDGQCVHRERHVNRITRVSSALVSLSLSRSAEKMQCEIDSTIGERPAHCNDRPQMRYTDAVLCEVQRFAALSRVVVHRVTEECDLNGYRIPRNTIALINFYSVHRDPTIWPSPDRFDPESNFLGDKTDATTSGKTTAESSDERPPLVRTEYLISFGLGKRQCLGEALARQVLFLFFVSILQKFTISAPDGDLSRAGAKLLSGLGGLKPPQNFFRLLQNFRLAPSVLKRNVKYSVNFVLYYLMLTKLTCIVQLQC